MFPFQQAWPWSQDPRVSAQTEVGSIKTVLDLAGCVQAANASPLLASASLQPQQTIHMATTAKHITTQILPFFLQYYTPSPIFILPDRTLELLFYSIDLSISPAQLPEHRRDKPTEPFLFHHHNVNLFGDWQILFDTKHIIQSQSPSFYHFFDPLIVVIPRFTHVASDDGF
jgi:hypothetical protein